MRKQAAVVGAGVGGLCAAIGLGRQGWQVTILERWPEVVGVGAALGLWPDAQHALAGLGVLDDVLARAVPYRGADIRTSSGRHLMDLPLARIERRQGAPVVLISRRALIEILLEHSAGADVRTSVTVEDVGGLSSDYDLVIGADGLQSLVRRSCFRSEAAPRYAGFTAWRGSAELEIDVHGEIWGPGQLFGATPMEAGRTNWYAAVRDHLWQEKPADGMALLSHLYEGWPAPVEHLLQSTAEEDLLRHPVFDLEPQLSTYVSDQIALLGDAAHPMTPSLGQGACQAILDATVLSGELDDVEDSLGVREALQRYDQARRRQTQRLVAGSRRASAVAMAERFDGLRDSLARLASPLAH